MASPFPKYRLSWRLLIRPKAGMRATVVVWSTTKDGKLVVSDSTLRFSSFETTAQRLSSPRGTARPPSRPSGAAIRPPNYRPSAALLPLHYPPSATCHPTIQFLPALHFITNLFAHFPSHPKLQLPSAAPVPVSVAKALAVNARTAVGTAVPAQAVTGDSSFKQATSVRFTNGAVAFKRASLVVVRAEGKTEPGPAGRGSAPAPPTSPPGLSGTEIPLGVISSTAPLEQGTDKPVGERIAYVCQDCGYVYDQETAFEDVPEDYNCPQCSAPKTRFLMANASVDEMLDTTKEDDAVSRGSGEKSGSPPSQN